MAKTHLLTSRIELLSLQNQWNQLVGGSPFLRFEWVMAWLNQLETTVKPYIILVTSDSGEWLGLAPLFEKRTSIGVRRLDWISSGPACADYLGIVARPEHVQEVNQLVAQTLFERKRCPELLLEGCAKNCPNMADFLMRLDRFGFTCHQEAMDSGWELNLPSSWDQLNQSFSSSMRRKTRKAIDRLADPRTAIWSSINQPYEVDRLWSTFVDLHQRRRISLGQPGCFANQKFHAFLKLAFKQLHAAGLAELIVVESEQTPIAAALVLKDHQTAYLYQSGVNPEVLQREPGYQFIVVAIQHAIERGFKKFDFLRGNEKYKTRWNTRPKPMVRIRIAAPRPASQIRHGIWVSAKSLKEMFLRSSPPRSDAEASE